jgi:glycosyltransferase involved in cell wall biosynthesis
VKTFPSLPPNPGVSYIMPVLNEAEYLADAIGSIQRQNYSGEQEIILALGASSDDTNQIAAGLAQADPRISWVHNPANDVPIGLNLAIRASKHPVIIRVDAHSEIPANYAEVMVTKLSETGAANVGGVMLAKGKTPLQKAIARTYNSPFGMGGGSYHGGDQEGPAVSAYLGCYRREVFDEVGMFDPNMRRAQEWELNFRIRAAGYQVWFTPEIEVGYWPRNSLEKLRKQMYTTGVWRGHMARNSQREWKHFAPPALVAGLAFSAMLAAIGLAARKPKQVAAGAALPVSYLGGLELAALRTGADGPFDWLLNIVCLGTVHLSWGAGFLRGWLRGAADTVDHSRVV